MKLNKIIIDYSNIYNRINIFIESENLYSLNDFCKGELKWQHGKR